MPTVLRSSRRHPMCGISHLSDLRNSTKNCQSTSLWGFPLAARVLQGRYQGNERHSLRISLGFRYLGAGTAVTSGAIEPQFSPPTHTRSSFAAQVLDRAKAAQALDGPRPLAPKASAVRRRSHRKGLFDVVGERDLRLRAIPGRASGAGRLELDAESSLSTSRGNRGPAVGSRCRPHLGVRGFPFAPRPNTGRRLPLRWRTC